MIDPAGEFHRQSGYVMRIEDNTTSGPPMRERCAPAIGFESSTHDASQLRCRKSARCVASRVTHATSEFVARRDTSPRSFAIHVALRGTSARRSEQSGHRGRKRKSRRHPAVQAPKGRKYA